MYPVVVVRALAASPVVRANAGRLITVLNKGGKLALRTLDDVWEWAKKDKTNALLVVSSIGALGLSLKDIFSNNDTKKALEELTGEELEQMVIEHGRGGLMGAKLSSKTMEVIEADSELKIEGLGTEMGIDQLEVIMRAPRRLLGTSASPQEIIDFHDRMRAFLELRSSDVRLGARLSPLKPV